MRAIHVEILFDDEMSDVMVENWLGYLGRLLDDSRGVTIGAWAPAIEPRAATSIDLDASTFTIRLQPSTIRNDTLSDWLRRSNIYAGETTATERHSDEGRTYFRWDWDPNIT